MACLHICRRPPRPPTTAAACEKQGINITVACPPHTQKHPRTIPSPNRGDMNAWQGARNHFLVFLVYRCRDGTCLCRFRPHTLLYSCRQTEQAWVVHVCRAKACTKTTTCCTTMQAAHRPRARTQTTLTNTLPPTSQRLHRESLDVNISPRPAAH